MDLVEQLGSTELPQLNKQTLRTQGFHMAEMTDERLEELLRLYTANWKVFPKDFYDEYWELWTHVNWRIKKLCKKDKSWGRACEVAEGGVGLDGLLSVSVAEGADPKLSKFSQKFYGAAPGWLTNVCKNWLRDLRDLSDGKGQYFKQQVTSSGKDRSEYVNANLESASATNSHHHFGLTPNATDMDTALDAADAATPGSDFLHVIYLVSIYSLALVEASQIGAHAHRFIERKKNVLVEKCAHAMHAYWGREPRSLGSANCDRIETKEMIEIFLSVGITRFGASTDIKAINAAYRQTISRCKVALKDKCAELFPRDCHN